MSVGRAYAHFGQLRLHEREGRDFIVRHRAGPSGLLIMAPHGGGIEPGTGDIADAVAARDHSFYGFMGIKNQGNRALHLPSIRFDEPRARAMTAEAVWILTVHGCHDREILVHVGGRDRRQADRIIRGLQIAGIPAQRCERPHMRGWHPDNLCNQGRRRAGVQLEISAGLRNKLHTDPHQRDRRHRTPYFDRLIAALSSCLPGVRSTDGSENRKPR
ncbi:MAG: poly-gamma-glutamate hydrolase family protein [Desulfobacterales bacterium]|jgi:phage replication-related protein YjqB (UPF0714/DUF867 family)